jgi:hypothetical protein
MFGWPRPSPAKEFHDKLDALHKTIATVFSEDVDPERDSPVSHVLVDATLDVCEALERFRTEHERMFAACEFARVWQFPPLSPVHAAWLRNYVEAIATGWARKKINAPLPPEPTEPSGVLGYLRLVGPLLWRAFRVR